MEWFCLLANRMNVKSQTAFIFQFKFSDDVSFCVCVGCPPLIYEMQYARTTGRQSLVAVTLCIFAFCINPIENLLCIEI